MDITAGAILAIYFPNSPACSKSCTKAVPVSIQLTRQCQQTLHTILRKYMTR